MSFIQPIVPAIGVPDRDASPAPRPDDIEEGLVAGCTRRAAEFAADLRDPRERLGWAVIGVLGGLLIYSYWPGLLNAKSSWDNPQYSHGWIVPLFAAGLLFWWREPIGTVSLSARAAGLGLLAGSFLLRLWCASYRIVTIDMYTFVPAVGGAFLLACGWSGARWAWSPSASTVCA